MSFMLGPTSFKALDRIREVGEKHGYRLFINFDSIAVDSCDMKYDFEDMYQQVKDMLEDYADDDYMDLDEEDKEDYIEELLMNEDTITGSRINIQLEPTENAERKDVLFMSFGDASVYIQRL